MGLFGHGGDRTADGSRSGSGRLSVREKICYAMGDASANIAWRGVGTFLFVFYTDVMGLLPAAVGTLMLVARVGDGVSDAVMGAIADRTRTRWGRYRPWMLWGALPLGVTLSLAFTCPPGLGMTGKLVYAYVTYILFTLAYTVQAIPYGALLSVLSPDEKERTSAGSYKMVGAFAGGLVVQGLLLVLKEHFNSYSIPIYIMSAVLVVLMPITFFGTRERVTDGSESPSSPSSTSSPSSPSSVWSDVRELVLHNPPWVVLTLVSMTFCAAVSVKQSVTVMYFAHFLGRETLCATYLTSAALCSVAAAGATSPLAKRFGKRCVFIAALLVFALASSLQGLCPASSLGSVFASGIVAEGASACFYTLCFVMMGDVADYAAAHCGRRPSGLVYSGVSFAMKAATGLAGLLVGAVLAAYGYDGKAAEAIAGAIPGIRSLMGWIPGALCALGAVLMAFYPKSTCATQSNHSRDFRPAPGLK